VDRKTAAKYIKDLDAPPEAAKAPRTYITRKTDFDKFWPEVQAMLGKTFGHDTFMCGLDFLNLDLR